jgi:hypothetical protein
MRIRLTLYLLILLPSVSFAQAPDNSYGMYSTFLDSLRFHKGEKTVFVVRKTIDFGRIYYQSDLPDMVASYRACLKSDPDKDCHYLDFAYKGMRPIITKDTLWLGLIERLSKKMKRSFPIKNKFSPELKVRIIGKHDYLKYFGKKKERYTDWDKFYQDYTSNAVLVDLSEVVSDGQRAVFYFGERCGGLCGAGGLILFYNDNGTWKYLREIGMWIS